VDSEPYIYDGRRRKGAAKRAAILDRAVAIASVEGLSGLTIGRIADELSISKGNLTALLGSKEALQLATLEAAMARFEREVVARAVRIRDPLARLVALCRAWFRHVERRVFPGGCFLHATASEYRARRGAIRSAIRRHRKAWNDRLESALREAQRGGRVRSRIDARDLVVELTSLQAGANVAALLGDREGFRRAERASLKLAGRDARRMVHRERP